MGYYVPALVVDGWGLPHRGAPAYPSLARAKDAAMQLYHELGFGQPAIYNLDEEMVAIWEGERWRRWDPEREPPKLLQPPTAEDARRWYLWHRGLNPVPVRVVTRSSGSDEVEEPEEEELEDETLEYEIECRRWRRWHRGLSPAPLPPRRP